MSDTPLIQQLDNHECNCKKIIFATHDRFYISSEIPVSFAAYQMSDTLSSLGIDATNTYLHLLYPVLNGSTVDPGIGSDLQDYFASTHTGILFTDVNTIQSIVDAILPSMGLIVGDAIYAVNTDYEPIWFLSPSAVSVLTNNTFIHPYFGQDSNWNAYDHKSDVTALSNNSNILMSGINTECIPIQEIKEKDSCTGEETYRYIIEDGTGNLVDASLNITGFDENNIFINCPEQKKHEYIPHVSGCIRRKTGTITEVCSTTNTIYEFSETDMVGVTITANDGNGNYTLIQEQANIVAHDKFLALLQNVSQSNARTIEDIGPGILTFNFWAGNVTNVISVSPTEVQLEIHVEPGVTDIPTALDLPCVDSVSDITYQNSASTLKGIYDGFPINVQQPNGGAKLIFTVTNYNVGYDKWRS